MLSVDDNRKLCDRNGWFMRGAKEIHPRPDVPRTDGARVEPAIRYAATAGRLSLVGRRSASITYIGFLIMIAGNTIRVPVRAGTDFGI